MSSQWIKHKNLLAIGLFVLLGLCAEILRIQEVSLDRGDVSIVTYGANPNTSVSLRAAFLDAVDLADDELDELRADPAVMSVIRRLSIETPEVVTPEVPATTVADLDTYLARAFVSRTRNTSRR